MGHRRLNHFTSPLSPARAMGIFLRTVRKCCETKQKAFSIKYETRNYNQISLALEKERNGLNYVLHLVPRGMLTSGLIGSRGVYGP